VRGPERPRRRAWLAVGAAVLLAGCVGRIRSIAPEYLAPIPADTAAAWAAAFAPAGPLQFDLRWVFENREGRAAGRATARFAPPDTLRFDYRGPFGRSGSALIVGDAAVWSEPEGDVDDLVPVAPVLWASLGVVLAPAEGAEFLGADTGERRAWRHVWGTHALDYIVVRGPAPRLLAELRDGTRILGVTEVVLAGPAPAHPTSAVMRFPERRSTFSLTVRQVDTVAPYPADTWKRP
jgi:hypothetical protein